MYTLPIVENELFSNYIFTCVYSIFERILKMLKLARSSCNLPKSLHDNTHVKYLVCACVHACVHMHSSSWAHKITQNDTTVIIRGLNGDPRRTRVKNESRSVLRSQGRNGRVAGHKSLHFSAPSWRCHHTILRILKKVRSLRRSLHKDSDGSGAVPSTSSPICSR